MKNKNKNKSKPKLKKEIKIKDLKKILYVPTLNIGVIYWRIEAYAQRLLKFSDKCVVNVNYLVSPYTQSAWDKLAVGHGEISQEIQGNLTGACRFFDVIIFQKIQYVEALALISKYKEEYPKVKFLMEIDDGIGDIQPSNPHMVSSHHAIAAQHCEISDGIIASTQYLADSLRKIVGEEKPIHVAPNCINSAIWKTKKSAMPHKETYNPDEIRVCYVGGASHDEDLIIAYKAILPLLDKRKFKFIIRYGGFRPDWLEDHPKIDFKTVGWDVWKYPQELANLRANFALAPLRDVSMNRCKSAIKWLEWAYLGVPIVASKVEAYKHLSNITLVDNNIQEWTAAIDEKIITIRFAASSKLIKKILRSEINQKYNLNRECKRLLRFFDSLC